MSNQEIINPENYRSFLIDIKSKIESARIQATRSVNRNLIELYWTIGKAIVDKQAELEWGDGVVKLLAQDLQHFYKGSGFSITNLWQMRRLYVEYKDHPILQQLVVELSWGSNLLILFKIKEIPAREYYLRHAVQMGWSRNTLLHHIKNEAYKHHQLANKQHSFEQTLPKNLSEQASDMMKDLYIFNIFEEPRKLIETKIENHMVEKIKPEYAGKMNFYLNLLDDFVKEPHENPSIGMILCSDRDRFEVEYALRGVNKPIGVSEYLLSKLPDPAKLEAEIRRELFLETKT